MWVLWIALRVLRLVWQVLSRRSLCIFGGNLGKRLFTESTLLLYQWLTPKWFCCPKELHRTSPLKRVCYLQRLEDPSLLLWSWASSCRGKRMVPSNADPIPTHSHDPGLEKNVWSWTSKQAAPWGCQQHTVDEGELWVTCSHLLCTSRLFSNSQSTFARRFVHEIHHTRLREVDPVGDCMEIYNFET